MYLTNKTDYSLRVVIFLLKSSDKKVKIQEMSDFFKIPKNHLKVIVSQLSRLNIIITSTGVYGGIELNPKALNMKLGEFVTKIENFHIVECFNEQDNKCVISGRCKLKGILIKANKSFLATMNESTLRDLK